MKEDKLFDVYLIKKVFNFLLKNYGTQGWWPLSKLVKTQIKSGWTNGYHPDDYSFPEDEFQKFEICLGTILTQNTSWENAKKALNNLEELDLLDPDKILSKDEKYLAQVIKPSGYYNQKAKKILNFSHFFIRLRSRIPDRTELLNIKGIGEETADSILLYAYQKPVFVVDNYTIRIINRLLGCNIENYSEMADFLTQAYQSSNSAQKTIMFNEYHALLVKHGKDYCLKNKPKCHNCFLRFLCNYS